MPGSTSTLSADADALAMPPPEPKEKRKRQREGDSSKGEKNGKSGDKDKTTEDKKSSDKSKSRRHQKQSTDEDEVSVRPMDSADAEREAKEERRKKRRRKEMRAKEKAKSFDGQDSGSESEPDVEVDEETVASSTDVSKAAVRGPRPSDTTDEAEAVRSGMDEEAEDEEELSPTMLWKMVFPSADEFKFALSLLAQLYTDVYARMVFDKEEKRPKLCISQINASRTALNVHTIPCIVYLAEHVKTPPRFCVPLQDLMRAVDSARNETPIHISVEDDPRNDLTPNDLVVVVPMSGVEEQDMTVIKMTEWNGVAPTMNPMKPDWTATMPVSKLMGALRVNKSRVKFSIHHRQNDNLVLFRVTTSNDTTTKTKEVLERPKAVYNDRGEREGTEITNSSEPMTVNRFRSTTSEMEEVFCAEFPGTIIAKFIGSSHLRPQTQIKLKFFEGAPMLMEATCGAAIAKIAVPPLIVDDSA